MKQSSLGSKTRLGAIVFIVLTVLNVAEYWLSVSFKSGIMLPLGVMALIDAWLIAYYFMHIMQIRHREE